MQVSLAGTPVVRLVHGGKGPQRLIGKRMQLLIQ